MNIKKPLGNRKVRYGIIWCNFLIRESHFHGEQQSPKNKLFGREDNFAILPIFQLARKNPSRTLIRAVKGMAIFQSVIYHMRPAYHSIRNTHEMQVVNGHWQSFLQSAYYWFYAIDHTVLLHSYLSVPVKLLAYEVISGDDYLNNRPDSPAEIITVSEAHNIFFFRKT